MRVNGGSGMIDEPYRWLDAIRNRREYIRDQMRGGTPVFAASRPEGILLLGAGGGSTKVFEIYDRHGMAALGNPVDIEKLRQTSIQAAHTDGFQRSPEDVTLRRLINFALSPVLKNAFEQIFSPPFIVNSIFAELGPTQEEDVLVGLQYDGQSHFENSGIQVATTDDELSRRAVEWLCQHISESDTLTDVTSHCLAVCFAIVNDEPVETLDPPSGVLLEVPNMVTEMALLDRRLPTANHYRELEPTDL